MDILNIRAARYLESGAIECEVRFSGMDEDITYTATADDTAQTGQAVWEALHSGKYPIEPFSVTQPLIDAARESKLSEINAWRTEQEWRSFIFEHGGHTWNGGRSSLERLAPASMTMETSTRDVMAWGDANNQPVQLTLPDLNQLLSAMATEQLKHNDRVYQQSRAMKEHLATLTTLSDIRSFQIL